jgi:PPM family protein phosphatase
MKSIVGYATHAGHVRESNQDTIGVLEGRSGLFQRATLPLFVVADGMGGHGHGETASRLAVETMLAYFDSTKETEPAEALSGAVRAANSEVYAKAEGDTAYHGMGTL